MTRIVLKIGSNLLTDASHRLDVTNMTSLIFQVADYTMHHPDIEFIIVSSGAITSGSRHIQQTLNTLSEKQAAASVGQIILFQQYYELFQQKNRCVGQLLLTKDNFDDSIKTANITTTINTLLLNHVIPIINENDSVSTDEIQFGDNDQLASVLAIEMAADILILLTNVDGLLDDTNTVVQQLSAITSRELGWVDSRLSSSNSRGGMSSKLLAASNALAAGIDVRIGNGRRPTIVADLLEKKGVGTFIDA
jgi:glutamate 5-kinase